MEAATATGSLDAPANRIEELGRTAGAVIDIEKAVIVTNGSRLKSGRSSCVAGKAQGLRGDAEDGGQLVYAQFVAVVAYPVKMERRCPTWMVLVRSRFQFLSDATVVRYSLAMEESVSPRFTRWTSEVDSGCS